MQDAFEVLHDVVVRHAQDAVALRGHEAVAGGVSIGNIGVGVAVHFDDQPFREAEDIGGVGAERDLVTPLVGGKRFAKAAEEPAFGFARLAAELPGAIYPAAGLVVVEAHVTLTPRR